MRKKISISTAITLIILAVALTVSITMLVAMRYFNDQVHSVSQRQAMYTHINEVDKTVREYYTVIEEEALQQSITAGYIVGLRDPYAVYFTPEAYEEEERRMSGKANNVGVEVCYNAANEVTVCKVHTDSAAAKAGVKKGDVITAIDGAEIGDRSLSSIQSQLDTAAKVLLSVQRDDTTKAFEVSAFEYTVRTVESTVIDSIGYVKITAFYKNTPDQFRSILSSLTEKGVTGIVFDLRDNVGGNKEAALEIISYLMPLGMYGNYIDTDGVITKLSCSVSNQLDLATVTLVNASTAGEAEFFAGVLQEFSLTTVVGETTAGKAKVQDYFILESDHSAIKLTVGEYGLLKSGSWEGVGVVPTLELILPTYQAAIYRLVEPAEDLQVQGAVAQISSSEPVVVSTTTTSTTTTTVASGSTTSTTAAKKD